MFELYQNVFLALSPQKKWGFRGMVTGFTSSKNPVIDVCLISPNGPGFRGVAQFSEPTQSWTVEFIYQNKKRLFYVEKFDLPENWNL